jgi:hypothetical protein
MGVAYYVSFEKSIEGIDPSILVDGKRLAQHSETLSTIAEHSKVSSLESFIGGIPDLEDVEEIETDEQWFDPQEGLRTAKIFIEFLMKHANVVSHQESVIEDLSNLKAALEFAQIHNTLWHLAIDI